MFVQAGNDQGQGFAHRPNPIKQVQTYRLQFSTDASILERRLKKALACPAGRLLGTGFGTPPPVIPWHHQERLIWAWEGPLGKEAPEGWDEYHWIVKEPPAKGPRLEDKEYVIAQPSKRGQRTAWIAFLKELQPEMLQAKIFFEFSPWTRAEAERMTTFEVAQFLYELKFHFPWWTPRRREGVELWNPNIPVRVELEASDFIEKSFGIQAGVPDISVVIPTYNNKYFIAKVIESLSKQSFDSSRFEVVVVDDGGSDSTLEYILTFGIHRKLQFKYIHWPKSGDLFRAGLCRNLGVRRSRGENIVFLDSDMMAPPGFLGEVFKELKIHDVLQFPRLHISQQKSGSATHIESLNSSDTYIEEDVYWRPFFETENWMAMEQFWKYTCTYGLALSRSSFYEAGRFCRFYVSYGFEDTNLGYRLANLGKQFKLVPIQLYHLTSYTHSQYQLSKIRRFELLQKTAKLFFLNTLDLQVFETLSGFMGGDRARRIRLKNALYSLGKNTSSDEKRSAST